MTHPAPSACGAQTARPTPRFLFLAMSHPAPCESEGLRKPNALPVQLVRALSIVALRDEGDGRRNAPPARSVAWQASRAMYGLRVFRRAFSGRRRRGVGRESSSGVSGTSTSGSTGHEARHHLSARRCDARCLRSRRSRCPGRRRCTGIAGGRAVACAGSSATASSCRTSR